jgi:circadian clock protein KaiC
VETQLKADVPAPSEDRASTGVPGLDYILCGGLPRNRLYLVQGHPGSGKTTLGLQFLLEGRRRGETTLVVALSENRSELHHVARSHGWNLDRIELYELESVEDQYQPENQYTVFHPSEIELSQTTRQVRKRIEELRPSRVVFDSLSELRLLADDPLRFRRELLSLKQFLSGRNCTALLLDDITYQETDVQVQSIVHGVILLERLPAEYGVPRRRISVAKMRGVRFRDGFHDYNINTGGLAIYPRLAAAEERMEIRREKFPSGLRELDDLLEGGVDRGTSTVILGPAGCGKSTLSTLYALTAGKRGERAACYLFEESRETFMDRAAGMGMELQPHVDSGMLSIVQVDPAEMSAGEFSHRVRQAVTKDRTAVVVIDSLNGYLNAMPSERYLLMHMHELLTYLGQQGVLSIMVVAQHGMMGNSMATPVDITYLADTVIMLRYFEAMGAVRQALSIIKKRKGGHERTIREMRLSSTGIQIGQPLRQFHGVLTGVPTYTGGSEEILQNDEGEERNGGSGSGAGADGM